jgi:hypothetical protein
MPVLHKHVNVVRNMRVLFFLLIITLQSCTRTNNNHRTIQLKDLGWHFQIPQSSVIIDSSFDVNGRLTDSIPSVGSSLKIFEIKDTIRTLFSCFVRKDTLNDLEWRQRFNEDSKWFFNGLMETPRFRLIDTSTSTKMIDSITFFVQHIHLIRKSTNDTGHIYHYFGKVKDNELNISFETHNTLGNKYMERVLNSSKFKN